MSYKITLRVYQTNQNAFFRVVEQTVFHDGSWSDIDGQRVLNMGYSGTSGTIRFESDTGENFLVAIGVHNYKRWCDIVTDLKTDREAGVTVNPQYYNNGERHAQREKQLASFATKNAHGRNIEVRFTVSDGNDLKANIIIG